MKIYKFIGEDKDKNDFKKNFMKEFVAKNKCKIIYKNKIIPLQSLLKIPENIIDISKIKLILYNYIYNINEIFLETTIAQIDQKNYKIERIKNKKNMNMYRFIKYHLCSSHEIFKLIYKINNEDKIKIFGDEFVGNNENKFSIIYKDNIFPLRTYFLINDINKEDKENKKFEILLLELEDILDRSYMFEDCESLIIFNKFEINNNEISDKQDGKEKYLYSEDSEDINKNNDFYPDNIDESIINEDIITNSFKLNLNNFLSEYNKVRIVKGNCYSCLKNMSYMFYGCSSLISLPDISKWNTKNVNYMNSMFAP